MAMEPHSHEHTHDEAHTHSHDADADAATPMRAVYGPVQFASLGIGVFFILIGSIGLARMGFDIADLRDRTTTVMGIGMTPLLAMIHIGIGVLALICAAGHQLARACMMIVGSILLAAGVALMIEPQILRGSLAANSTNGVAYLIAGGAGVATVIGTPMWFGRRRTYDERRHVPAM